MRRYGAEDATPDQFRVAAIRVRPDGEVWVGAVNGLYRLAAGSTADRFQRVSLGRDKPDGVRGFAEDPSGSPVRGQQAGHPAVDRSRAPQVHADATACARTSCRRSPFASDGSLVVAYRESIGAAKVILQGDRLTVRPIDTSTGLVSNKVVLVGRDASGAVWIGTGSGADVFGPDWALAARYGKADGMISDDLDQNAFLAEPDGTVWLGSSRGLTRVQAGVPPAPQPAPTVVITDTRRRRPAAGPGTPRRPRVGGAQLQRRLVRPDLHRAEQGPLSPPHARARRPVHRNGADRGALSGAAERATYRFEVLCVSAAGKVSREPAVFALEVPPAWWQTVWARILWALLAAGAVIAVVRWRTRHLEAERRRLEEAVAARSAELAAANRELREASFTDALTGARNRRFFSTVIEDDVNRTLRVHSTPPANRPRNCDLLFYIVDIDHFKEVNDEYGHDRGDGVLAEVARRLTQVVRDSDRLIRWGGEEFLLISRDADRTRGDVLAGRVMQAVGSEPFDLGGRPEGPADLLRRLGALSLVPGLDPHLRLHRGPQDGRPGDVRRQAVRAGTARSAPSRQASTPRSAAATASGGRSP